MSKSLEWREKRDRVIKERLSSVIRSLERIGLSDFKVKDYSIDFTINTRHVEFFIFTGSIIWEGKNPENLGKGIKCLIDLIKEERNKGLLDSYIND